MKNEVAKKTETPPAIYAGNQSEELLQGNTAWPRLLLMQGLSEFVAQKKAFIGDIVKSSTIEKVGDDKEDVEIIPITFRNTWRLEECLPGQKAKFKSVEPRNAGNDDLPWEFKKDGAPWKRTKVIELFAIIPKDIDADEAERNKVKRGEFPDLDKVLMPVVVTFRSKSFNAGKLVNNHFAKARTMGVPPFAYTITIGCKADKNDKGTFHIWEIRPKTHPVKKEHQAVVNAWADLVTTKVAKGEEVVHDIEDAEGTEDIATAQF